SAEELPESLRPLTRRNALELENTRWEYDVGRLVRAVEQLVDPAPSPQPDPERWGTTPEATQEQIEPAKGSRRSRKVLAAGLGGLVIVVALVVFLLRPPGPG